MRNLPARRRARVDHCPSAELIDRPAAVVPGTNIPVLTFKILDYGGQPRHVALEQVRQEKQSIYRGCFVQVVPAEDARWEYVA